MTALPDPETRVHEARVGESHVADATAVEVGGLRAGLTASRRDVERAIDHLAASVSGDDLGWAPDDEVCETLLGLIALQRRLQALTGDVAARVANGNGFATAGFRSAPSWVRARTNEAYASAQRIFEHGEWMSRVPVMAQAWRDGQVSLRHVRALVEAHERYWRLSSGLTQLEPVLVDLARQLEPKRFESTLMGTLFEIDSSVVDEVQSKRRRHDVGLHVSKTLDGFVRVDGLLTPELGQQLINTLAAAADKARRDNAAQTPAASSVAPGVSAHADGQAAKAQPWLGYVCANPLCPNYSRLIEEFAAAPLDPESCSACHRASLGENPDVPHEPHIPLSQRNLEALQILLDSAASAMGDDRLPDVGGARPVVQITIPSESLMAEGSAAPGWITSLTGQLVTPVSAATARRLACDSVRQILLIDPRGHLDAISKLERVIPLAMRKAITIRDAGQCRFPGCKAAIREIHHIVYWQHGGTTTTDNLVGLCSFHHHHIHDRGWTLSGNPNARVTFTDPLKRDWHSEPPLLAPHIRQ